jgi:hypothetical protein
MAAIVSESSAPSAAKLGQCSFTFICGYCSMEIGDVFEQQVQLADELREAIVSIQT